MNAKLFSFILLASMITNLDGGIIVDGQSLPTGQRDKKPHLEIQEQSLVTENFPAYSILENAILLEHEDFSCCYSGGKFLKKIDVATMQVSVNIMLYPPSDSVEIDHKEVIKSAEFLIDSGAFKSMMEIDNEHFYIQRELTSEWSKLGFWLPQLKPREVSLRVPQMTLPEHCCEDVLNRSLPCKARFNRYRLWIDLTNKIILLAYGSTSETNGCDAGPEYIAKKFR